MGADAFHVGYPQLKPAQVHTRYIGRVRIERPQRGMPPELGHVWVEVARAPDFDGSLGGLSGVVEAIIQPYHVHNTGCEQAVHNVDVIRGLRLRCVLHKLLGQRCRAAAGSHEMRLHHEEQAALPYGAGLLI